MWRGALRSCTALQKCIWPTAIGGQAAADAWAANGRAGLGGWWLEQGSEGLDQVHWFSLEVTTADFPGWMRLAPEMSTDIAFYELVAQVLLLVLRFQTSEHCQVTLFFFWLFFAAIFWLGGIRSSVFA